MQLLGNNYIIKHKQSSYGAFMKKTISERKDDHLQINLEKNVSSVITSGLENVHLEHQALPEINYSEINTETFFFGKKLSVPFLISSMTGGSDKGQEINKKISLIAQHRGLAMGVGSMRVALKETNNFDSFQVRRYAPDILLFSNLGAVQLNYGIGVDDCQKAVDEIEADALILHLNPLQEAVQPEGNKDFSGLIKKIERVCRQINVPVIVKEVGWGISEKTANMLISAGVAAIDVAGAGGTSWSEVERYRATNRKQQEVAGAFKEWGINTVQSILNVKRASSKIPIIASGGLKNGVDIAKCLALGASICGMAGRLIKSASISEKELDEVIETIFDQLKITMFVSGVSTIPKLQKCKIIQRV